MRKSIFKRKPGFTLMEVLITMGIFAVGFVAVAAIFPTAVLLQKKTVDDVMVQQVAQNAKAMLRAKKLSISNMGAGAAGWPINGRLSGVGNLINSTGDPAYTFLPEERSYPSSILNVAERKLFWVMRVRDPNPDPGVIADEVVTYVFILQREPDSNYTLHSAPALNWSDNGLSPSPALTTPKLVLVQGNNRVTADPSESRFRFGHDFQNRHEMVPDRMVINVGDKVVDKFGGIYTVVEASYDNIRVDGYISPNPSTGELPDELLFGYPDDRGRSQPLKDVLVLSGVVRP